jgi:hypothetical protein
VKLNSELKTMKSPAATSLLHRKKALDDGAVKQLTVTDSAGEPTHDKPGDVSLNLQPLLTSRGIGHELRRGAVKNDPAVAHDIEPSADLQRPADAKDLTKVS